MQALPAAPDDDHEVGADEEVEVLRHRLAGHAQALAQLPQRLPVVLPQAVEQQPPGGVGQRLEDLVHPCLPVAHRSIMQVNACLLSRGLG